MLDSINLSLVVDMAGCPNRCKHCWLSHMPNIKMPNDSDEFIINYFKPYFKNIDYYSWLREPDYMDDYRNRWFKDNEISVGIKPMRFELASFYRLVRDSEYVSFLKEVNTKVVQLTFFGLEELTDKFIGRKGAFNELLKATEILLENEIAPRWQCFINEENKDEIYKVFELSEKLHLKEKCANFGQEFKFFVHPGSCDGENFNLYPIRINKGSISNELKEYMLDFGDYLSEAELVEILKNDDSHLEFSYGNQLVLNITNSYDVYFNFTHTKKSWRIGNIKTDDSKILVKRILNYDVEAINKAKNITISELVEMYGDSTSNKLFDKHDYKMYLLLKYLND